jgi:hypothetical protein
MRGYRQADGSAGPRGDELTVQQYRVREFLTMYNKYAHDKKYDFNQVSGCAEDFQYTQLQQ